MGIVGCSNCDINRVDAVWQFRSLEVDDLPLGEVNDRQLEPGYNAGLSKRSKCDIFVGRLTRNTVDFIIRGRIGDVCSIPVGDVQYPTAEPRPSPCFRENVSTVKRDQSRRPTYLRR